MSNTESYVHYSTLNIQWSILNHFYTINVMIQRGSRRPPAFIIPLLQLIKKVKKINSNM